MYKLDVLRGLAARLRVGEDNSFGSTTGVIAGFGRTVLVINGREENLAGKKSGRLPKPLRRLARSATAGEGNLNYTKILIIKFASIYSKLYETHAHAPAVD